MGDRYEGRYLVDLGDRRKEPVADLDPVWVWIHDERVRRGIGQNLLAEMAGLLSNGIIARGEITGGIGLVITRKVLRALGKDLVMIDYQEPPPGISKGGNAQLPEAA